MTALRPMIVNEVLCFITKKLGRLAVRQLNSTLYDFYSGDVWYVAKEILLDAVQSSKMEIPPKVIRRRRDSKEIPDARIRLDIDDLITTITDLDEKTTIDDLHLFVVADNKTDSVRSSTRGRHGSHDEQIGKDRAQMFNSPI